MRNRLFAGALGLSLALSAAPALANVPAEPTKTIQRAPAARQVPRPPYKVRRAINHFWGSNWREGQARRVAYCESTYRTWAVNGSYKGIFQMGVYERATYGHGSTAWAQARGAHRYFVATDRTWSPWVCKP